MNDKDLRNLIQHSDVEVSADFTLNVMAQVQSAGHSSAVSSATMRWIQISLLGCLGLFVFQPFAISACLDWVMVNTPLSEWMPRSAIERPLQIGMVVITILCCSQCFKMYVSEKGKPVLG